MTMNKPIRNIMFFALIMVIILMANLSIVHVFKEDEYANNPLNRRMFIKAKLQPRGQISAGGIVLAESKKKTASTTGNTPTNRSNSASWRAICPTCMVRTVLNPPTTIF